MEKYQINMNTRNHKTQINMNTRNHKTNPLIGIITQHIRKVTKYSLIMLIHTPLKDKE